MSQRIEDTIPQKGPKEVIPVIHNIHILDISGSMSGQKIQSAISGMNEEIETLFSNTDGISYTQTLMTFSGHSQISTIHYKIPFQISVPNIKTLGMTAMYDAIGTMLKRLISEHNPLSSDKYLIKIFTDGMENASVQFDKHSIAELIKEAENLGFTITFVGTDIDVKNVVNNLHIKLSNTLVHDNSALGIQKAFRTSTVATMMYSKAVVEDVKLEELQANFYTRAES